MQNTALALMNMEITMKAPVFVGDTIHGEVEILEARLSKSRPGRGLVRSRVNIVKQDGTVAITYTPLRMVKCREAK
jgi:acyl dehydratase